MENSQQSPQDYERPAIPPGTPPTVDSRADAEAAAAQTLPNGDSDYPGNRPDEVQPGGGDIDQPDRGNPEQQPPSPDIDQPGESPAELPEQPETPTQIPPPD